MKKNILVFDVESTSLHGIGFAVGAIVIEPGGFMIDKFELLSVEGASMANDWVKENVIPQLKDMPTCAYNYTLREKFYEFYMKHKDTCEVWSDCNFPVETNFLSAIVLDDFNARQWNMPYPLKDISTIVDINVDRTEYATRLGATIRKHHPLDDAQASALILIETLTKKNK